jgi:GNAT superfamily N-acetyltransferase
MNSSDGLVLHRATLADLPLLLSWRETVLREVFSVPDTQDMTTLMQANQRYYEHALPRGEHIACLAYLDDTVVGCGGVCCHHEMPSPDNPSGTCGYLMNVYTSPQHRHQGIGRLIVRWLIEHARASGAGKIYLEASEDAYALYRSLGFQDLEGYMLYPADDTCQE